MAILNKKNIYASFILTALLVFMTVLSCQQPADKSDSITAGDTSWHEVGISPEPLFLNDWGNVAGYSTCAFRKDGLGIVHLKGRVLGTASTIIFYLPAGYRPSVYLTIGNTSNSVSVGTNGAVISSTTSAYLDGISFYIN